MTFARLDTADRIEAEAIAEPVEQGGNLVCGRLRSTADEFDLLGGKRFDREDREDHVLDPETGIVPQINCVELRREELGQMARVAVRPGGAERDMLDPAVDAVKGEIEAACPYPLAGQPRHQIRDQPLDRAGEI